MFANFALMDNLIGYDLKIVEYYSRRSFHL